MGMDAMMMAQGMYGGFNGGMGMNGMHMGMGLDGGYGVWGGNNAMGAMGGVMNGDFGANAGYYPSGGYNQQSSSSHQGHFNQMQNSQKFPHSMNNYQQNRFQGGRAGYSQARDLGRDRHPHYGQQAGQYQTSARDNAASDAQTSPMTDEFGRDLQKGKVEEQTSNPDGGVPDDQTAQEQDSISSNKQEAESFTPNHNGLIGERVITSDDGKKPTDDDLRPGGRDGMDEEDTRGSDMSQNRGSTEKCETLQPIAVLAIAEESYDDAVLNPFASIPPSGPAVPVGPAVRYFPSTSQEHYSRGRVGLRGFGRGAVEGRGGVRGRGGYGQPVGFAEAVPVEPKGQGVVGAPTGPKAMRDGLPNAGFRGRGAFHIAGRGASILAVPNRSTSAGHEK